MVLASSSVVTHGSVVGLDLEDVGLDDLPVPEVGLQPDLVVRLRLQVGQHHRVHGVDLGHLEHRLRGGGRDNSWLDINDASGLPLQVTSIVVV